MKSRKNYLCKIAHWERQCLHLSWRLWPFVLCIYWALISPVATTLTAFHFNHPPRSVVFSVPVIISFPPGMWHMDSEGWQEMTVWWICPLKQAELKICGVLLAVFQPDFILYVFLHTSLSFFFCFIQTDSQKLSLTQNTPLTIPLLWGNSCNIYLLLTRIIHLLGKQRWSYY